MKIKNSVGSMIDPLRTIELVQTDPEEWPL